MPSHPKKRARTGSVLLGAELKRLRGGRSLEDIAELSRTPPVSHHVAPIAAPTLCQLETGTSMPTMQTLYTLSHVYRLSMNRLMGYVTEDRLAETGEKFEGWTQEQLYEEFSKRLRACRWHAALAVALHGERSASSERSRIAWRGNRASCLAKVGLHDEGMALALTCLDHPGLDERQRFIASHNLAMMAHAAGQFRVALTFAREAIRIAEEAGLGAADVDAIVLLRGQVTVETARSGMKVSEAEIRAAVRELEPVLASWSDADSTGRLDVALTLACLQFCLGNRLVAERDFTEVASRCRGAQYVLGESLACLWLGLAGLRSGRPEAAERAFVSGLALAEDGKHLGAAFEHSFELFKLLRKDRPTQAVRHYRRCKELHAVLAERSPGIADFERFELESA